MTMGAMIVSYSTHQTAEIYGCLRDSPLLFRRRVFLFIKTYYCLTHHVLKSQAGLVLPQIARLPHGKAEHDQHLHPRAINRLMAT